MDGFWIPFMTAVAALGAVTGIGALLLHRRFVGELRHELAQAERARLAFDEQMTGLRHQLTLALQAPGSDGEERQRMLERMLDAVQPSADFPWLETLPAEVLSSGSSKEDAFDSTRPAALDISVGER